MNDDQTLLYLSYVRNTAGNATLANFIEDWEPVGHMAWDQLQLLELVCLVGGRVHLTPQGDLKLNTLQAHA